MPNQWLLLLLSVVHLVPAGAATAPGLTPQPPGVVSARGETGRTYEAGDLRSEFLYWGGVMHYLAIQLDLDSR